MSSIHSLHCAIRTLAQKAPMLVLEGDLLLDPRILKDLLDDPRSDLVSFGPVRQSRPWLVKLAANGQILRWGYDLPGGDGEMVEDFEGHRFSIGRHFGFADEALDLGEVAMVFLDGAIDVEFAGSQPRPFDLLDAKLRSGREAGKGFEQGLTAGSGVDERSDGHVTADSGKRIEVADSHFVVTYYGC